MIKLVLFDVGGVLIDLFTDQARQTLESEYGMTREAYQKLTRCSYEEEPFSITELATIGRAATAEYIEAFRAACRYPVPLSVMKQNCERIIGDERAPMIKLITALKETVRVAAFTNTIEIHWNILRDRQRFSFPALVEKTIASHLVGFGKPTRIAYQEVTRILEVDPSEVLFIDDSKINVAGAEQSGMQGMLFTNYRDLVENLRRENLLR
jgi:FMN phosphatase YigB (HAD superfamily)